MDKQTISFLQPYLSQNKKVMILSVILSVCSVMIGFAPYFAVFWLMTGLLSHTLTARSLLVLSLACVSGYLLTAMTTDMSFMEYHAMTMLDMVVNGYIISAVMLIFCVGVDWRLRAIMGAGLLVSALFLHLMGKASYKNGAVLQKTMRI